MIVAIVHGKNFILGELKLDELNMLRYNHIIIKNMKKNITAPAIKYVNFKNSQYILTLGRRRCFFPKGVLTLPHVYIFDFEGHIECEGTYSFRLRGTGNISRIEDMIRNFERKAAK
jgi:hypothetical protein